jgi:hypothetical protein
MQTNVERSKNGRKRCQFHRHFYEHIFCTFMCFQFGFTIFCQNEIGAKCDFNMLVTMNVNFLNILCEAFRYKAAFLYFEFCLYFWLMGTSENTAHKMLVNLTEGQRIEEKVKGRFLFPRNYSNSFGHIQIQMKNFHTKDDKMVFFVTRKCCNSKEMLFFF